MTDLEGQYNEAQRELISILHEFSRREPSYYDVYPVYTDDLVDKVYALELRVGGISILRSLCPESYRESFSRYIRRA